ncbi:zinc-binding dehydrogenase [Aquimarina celericrescens]|uniref:Zinc-binding dehydrogenase n=1 Tax=Aquimarina celericrescens TaxID=1964542 RepID=A0ABW5AU94_9FLAO|nr:zinc-binding dehydrogenase [Aquimarina celericrescens]
MKAAHLVKYGAPETAFEIKEIAKPKPESNQVLIKVEAFGINFADIMARLGLYKDAPPLPAILGYDVIGYIEQIGADVKKLKIGDRVIALTQFGGYAEYAISEDNMTNKVSEAISIGAGVALATQYCTAYFLFYEMANIQEKEKILIHAAAGGVGTALTQFALLKNCIIFGTCSSAAKIKYLRKNGVQYPINYLQEDFAKSIQGTIGEDGLDAVFDPVGGKSVKKGYKLLAPGGRLLSFGVSSINKAKSIFGKLKVLAQFGIYHPLQFLSSSKGIIGVNMLKVAKERPEKVSKVMREVIQLTEKKVLQPHVGAEYTIDELAEAHRFLESRKSTGKIVVKW